MKTRFALLALAALTLPGSLRAQPQEAAPPAEPGALIQYLKQGRYLHWQKEGARHPSKGPHPVTVVAYLNPALHASFAAGGKEHPAGAAAVKELYDKDGKLSGWAVAVKLEAKSRLGRGWYWYEIVSPDPGAKPIYEGRGVALCVACHVTGRDYVLTEFPLR